MRFLEIIHYYGTHTRFNISFFFHINQIFISISLLIYNVINIIISRRIYILYTFTTVKDAFAFSSAWAFKWRLPDKCCCREGTFVIVVLQTLQ